jgi:hypothetical protein
MDKETKLLYIIKEGLLNREKLPSNFSNAVKERILKEIEAQKINRRKKKRVLLSLISLLLTSLILIFVVNQLSQPEPVKSFENYDAVSIIGLMSILIFFFSERWRIGKTFFA